MHASAVDRLTKVLTDPFALCIARINDMVIKATSAFWQKYQGASLFLPMTTGAVSSPIGRGSDSKPVKVSIDGNDIYLADSMQFYLELAVRLLGVPCYYIMPSFRGEPADDMHLPQFFHSEAEIAGSLEDVITIAEEYLVFILQQLLSDAQADLAEHGAGSAHIERLIKHGSIPRIRFEEAIDMVGNLVTDHGDWRTLTRPGERLLTDRFQGPVWITHFDHLAVPFYQAFESQLGSAAACADLLIGQGELIGAGQRHATKGQLLDAIGMHQVDATPYEWYLTMKELKPLTTSGFGLGVERLLMWVFGRSDIREVQLIPRIGDPATDF